MNYSLDFSEIFWKRQEYAENIPIDVSIKYRPYRLLVLGKKNVRLFLKEDMFSLPYKGILWNKSIHYIV